jgi:hypothetical protein
MYELDQHLRCHIVDPRQPDLCGDWQQFHQYRCRRDGGRQLAVVAFSPSNGFLLVGRQQYSAVGRNCYFAHGGLHRQPYKLRVGGLLEFDRHLCC